MRTGRSWIGFTFRPNVTPQEMALGGLMFRHLWGVWLGSELQRAFSLRLRHLVLEAREFVLHLSQRVILMDGQSLADLLIEHGVGVSE